MLYVNLDRDSVDDYRGVVLAVPEAPRGVTLYFPEDANRIVAFLREQHYPDAELLDPAYWSSYHEACRQTTRLVPRLRTGPLKIGQHKYDIRKLLQCTDCTCPDPDHRCRRTAVPIGRGYHCECRPKFRASDARWML